MIKRRKAGVALPPKIVLPKSRTMIATKVCDYILMFYGPPGVGKTTFVDELAPRVLFISTDRGTRFLDTMRLECHTFAQLEQIVRALEQPGAADNYDLVALDHIDDICTMIESNVCAKLNIESLGDAGYGKGWNAYRKAIRSMVQRLLKLKLGVVFIAHETTRDIEVRAIKITRTMPQMPKSAWDVVIPMADLIGYCGFRRVKNKGEKQSREVRTLETNPREELYAKDRTKRKKSANGWELLNGKSFIATFGASNSNGKKENKQEENPKQIPFSGGKVRGRRARS